MCRLYGFRASEPTKVECTLVHAQNALLIQSQADLRGVSHADGWGIAYFAGDDPHIERRAAAAHADVTFSATAERFYATTVIAHIRRATVGAPSVTNTHPFHFGRWVFAHNGTLTGFEALRDQLETETQPVFQRSRQGTTDSEQAFYWLLSRMVRAGIDPLAERPEVQRLVRVLADAIAELSARCTQARPDRQPKLNVLLTEGHVLLAAAWGNTLHWLLRRGVHDCEICGIPHVVHHPQHPYRAVVVASEPISHEAWAPVPEGHILSVDPDLGTGLHAI